jgi:hypothetical protein
LKGKAKSNGVCRLKFKIILILMIWIPTFAGLSNGQSFVTKEIVVKKVIAGENYIIVTKEMHKLNKRELSNASINIYNVSTGVYLWVTLKMEFDKIRILSMLNKKTKKEFIKRERLLL